MNICYLWVGVPKLFESMSSVAAVKRLDRVLGIFEEQLSYSDFWELKKQWFYSIKIEKLVSYNILEMIIP